MSSRRFLGATALAVAAVVLVALAEPLAGQQAGALAGQSLRPYRFVFYAYAVAWILVFGWVVAVARRLSALDRRLED
jgi:CcmD family protein